MYNESKFKKYPNKGNYRPAVNVLVGYATYEVGIDNYTFDDMIIAAKLLVKPNLRDLAQHINGLDTPRKELVMHIIDEYEPESFEAMFGVMEPGEYYAVMRPII